LSYSSHGKKSCWSLLGCTHVIIMQYIYRLEVFNIFLKSYNHVSNTNLMNDWLVLDWFVFRLAKDLIHVTQLKAEPWIAMAYFCNLTNRKPKAVYFAQKVIFSLSNWSKFIFNLNNIKSLLFLWITPNCRNAVLRLRELGS